VSTATDELVELDIDLNKPVPCQFPLGKDRHACAQEATWRGVARPCGHGINHCEEHYQERQKTPLFSCRAYQTERHDLVQIDWTRL